MCERFSPPASDAARGVPVAARAGRPALFLVLTLISTASALRAEPAPATPRAAWASAVLPQVPEHADAAARYLIYLHGAIIEEEGVRPTSPRFGVYEYRRILDTFAERGFVVISQARPRGTEVGAYAGQVASQVDSLIEQGVAPERVTVVGFSKGGAIAIRTSELLRNPRVNFVLLAACGNGMRTDPPRLVGRILSIHEASDDIGRSCRDLTGGSGSPVRREIEIHVGGGHGAFYRPVAAWVDPVVEWASGQEENPRKPTP